MQSNLCITTTLWTGKNWSLLTGGLCSEVITAIKGRIGTLKQWPQQTGGRYSEVVVSSGLTNKSSQDCLNPQIDRVGSLLQICCCQNDACEWKTLNCRQFHQHFMYQFFVRTSFPQLSSSYMYVEKAVQNDVHTKNCS